MPFFGFDDNWVYVDFAIEALGRRDTELALLALQQARRDIEPLTLVRFNARNSAALNYWALDRFLERAECSLLGSDIKAAKAELHDAMKAFAWTEFPRTVNRPAVIFGPPGDPKTFGPR